MTNETLKELAAELNRKNIPALEDDIQREFLLCPGCEEYVNTKPTERVPNQSLRTCNKCETDFFIDLHSKPIYTKPVE